MAHDPDAGKNLRSAIPKYALNEFVEEFAQTAEVVAVLNCFIPEETSSSVLQSVITDCVFRYLLATGKSIYFECEGKNFEGKLDGFLKSKTRLTGKNLTNFRDILRAAVLATMQDRPDKKRRKSILAKQSANPCYICGRAIDAGQEKLDHVWPLNAGGGCGSNLMRAHRVCEETTRDLAVCGDTPIGRFAFAKNLPRHLSEPPNDGHWWPRTLSNDEEFFSYADDLRATQLRFAVLRRQDFKCVRCKKEIREVGEGRLSKREDEEPWWFPNTEFLCNTCDQGTQNAKL
ncbi:MAG: hypothetical protein ACK5ZC_11350 [Pirellulaceae bacterium]|jgi:hypothetical protein